MISPPRERMVRAFSAADQYDRNARVQRRVADRLALDIAELDLPPSPRVLEIGCGTGFLTEALTRAGIGGEWMVTDIAPAMLRRCRERLGEQSGIRYAELDGEYPTLDREERFDLICSSLAAQWFDDLEVAMTRLLGHLAPGGHCIVTTLAAGTFTEWHSAHLAEGLTPGTPQYPSMAELAAMRPLGLEGRHRIDHYVEQHDNARDFLRSLKSIGAGTAHGEHHPLRSGELRRVMDAFDRTGARITYEVATCHFRAGPAT